jgi:hypothetical protein
VRQAAQSNIRKLGELGKIQRLNRQAAPAPELWKDLGRRPALLRQRRKICQPCLAVLQEYANRFGTRITAGPYYRDAYHKYLLKKNSC